MNAPATPLEVGRTWFTQMWNQRDAGLARELMAPDATGYLEGGRTITGPEDFLDFQRAFLEVMPDLRIGILNILSNDEDVCIHWEVEGTHSGTGMGLIPSGNPVNYQGTTWLKVKNGKIVESRDFWNMGAVMQTLTGKAAETA